MRHLVIGLQQENTIDRIVRELRIIGAAENGINVVDLVPIDATINVRDGLGINVHGINQAAISDAFRGAHREPSGAGPDIRDMGSRDNPEDVHHFLDLQFLVPAVAFENGKIARIGLARLAGR